MTKIYPAPHGECLKNVKKSFFPYRAADKGHYEVIRVLASYGADLGKVNTNGNTSLHIAATKGYGQICKFLAQRGKYDQNTLWLCCDPCFSRASQCNLYNSRNYAKNT